MKRYYQAGGVFLLVAVAVVFALVFVTPPMKAKATGYLIFGGYVYKPDGQGGWTPANSAFVYVKSAPSLSDTTPCNPNDPGSYCNYDGVLPGFSSCVYARDTIGGVPHEDVAYLEWNGTNPTYHNFYMTPGSKRCRIYGPQGP